MEIKAKLLKPYTEEARINFIIEQNHNKGYEIKETEEALEAWGYTEEEIQEKEKERINTLSMTRSDFFDGTIKALGADDSDLLTVIQDVLVTTEIEEMEKKIALNNFKNALNFYRKHPLFSILSNTPIKIGEKIIIISNEQWDNFFNETNKGNKDAWKEIIPNEVIEEVVVTEEEAVK